MDDSVLLTLLLLVLSFLMSLVILLLVLLMRTHQTPLKWMRKLLQDQETENQKLRNLLLSKDVMVLNSLNYSTLPPETTSSNSDDILDPVELARNLMAEDELAQEGFTSGELTDDLISAGWTPPYRGEDGSTFIRD